MINDSGMMSLPMAMVPIYLTKAKRVTFVGHLEQSSSFAAWVSVYFYGYNLRPDRPASMATHDSLRPLGLVKLV